MSQAYYKIICGDDVYYYPYGRYTQDEAMAAARAEFQCEPVCAGLEIT